MNDPKIPVFTTNLESTTPLHDLWLICLVCGFFGAIRNQSVKRKNRLNIMKRN